MKKHTFRLAGILAVVVVGTVLWVYAGDVSPLGTSSAPAGTGFTYQGQLEKEGSAVTDSCDFEFSLWNDATAGSEVGTSPQIITGVSVQSGLFTVDDLDFGGDAFNGEARWLGMKVCCPSGGCSFESVEPRQRITPAPYALHTRGVLYPDTIADLRAATPPSGPRARAFIAGYHSPGDGGGGTFYWDASASEPDNNGTVISPSSSPAMGRWKRLVDGPLSVHWFGARGQPPIDDEPAISATVAAAGPGGIVTFMPATTYRINSTVTFDCNVEGRGATIEYEGANTAIEIPEGVFRNIWLPHVVKTTKAWSAGNHAGDVGVRITNLKVSHVTIPQVREFSTGILCEGNGALTGYNDFHLLRMENNMIGLHLKPVTTDGFVNENFFRIGQFIIYTHEGTNIPGTRFLLLDDPPASSTNFVNNKNAVPDSPD